MESIYTQVIRLHIVCFHAMIGKKDHRCRKMFLDRGAGNRGCEVADRYFVWNTENFLRPVFQLLRNQLS